MYSGLVADVAHSRPRIICYGAPLVSTPYLRVMAVGCLMARRICGEDDPEKTDMRSDLMPSNDTGALSPPVSLRPNLLVYLQGYVILASLLHSLLCRRPLASLPKIPLSLVLAPPRARLSLISRHLENRPVLEINTPFSTERQSTGPDDVDYTPIKRDPPKPAPPEQKEHKMPNQPDHPTLLIPGPIEFDDAVLDSMGHYRCVARSSLSIALY